MNKFKPVISILLILTLLCACAPLSSSNAETVKKLEVHFLDVGQADCALVLCDGKSLLIDGGNSDDSSLLYSYLRNHGVNYLDYIIATHPHEDHVGGITGALSYAKAGVCFSPVSEDDNPYFIRLAEKLGQMGVPITVPSPGYSFSLGDAKITFLGPLEKSNDVNEISLVCRLVYGDISFLFTGDAGDSSEKLLLEGGQELESTVLKVGHHGSAGSSSYTFLREVNPVYAVISTENNSRYGHPHEATLSRLIDAGATIYRTDRNGDIVFTSDGSWLNVNVEKSAGIALNPKDESNEDENGAMYIGNISSRKYHRLTCKGLPKESNRIYFYSLEEAINSGFSPCGSCKP